jgi:hypothetical protein
MKLTIPAAGLLVLSAIVLAGCTADPGAVSDPDATGKFVACLNASGQTAKIFEGGQVALLMPEMASETGTIAAPPVDAGDGTVAPSAAIFMDDDGPWMAASSADGYPEDGGMREAWAGCEKEVPGFSQPAPSMAGGEELEMVSSEQIVQAGLDFAACARDEGYADFADPDENGMVAFPIGLSEDEFRTLLTACVPDDGIVPGISQESTESFDLDWMSVLQEFGNGGMITMGTTSEVVE